MSLRSPALASHRDRLVQIFDWSVLVVHVVSARLLRHVDPIAGTDGTLPALPRVGIVSPLMPIYVPSSLGRV
jgi:hypothetical protein